MKLMYQKLPLLLALGLGVAAPAAQAQVAPAGATAAQTGSIDGVVTTEAGDPAAGVSVVALHLPSGIRRRVITDDKGAFGLAQLLAGGPYALQVTQPGYRPRVTANLFVSAGKPVSINYTLVADVVAVGTRRADRSANDALAPVDVVDMRELALSAPRTDNTQLLNYVVPSFNSNRETSADGGDHVDNFSLRGLGVDQVLVLVNGHRRHSSALINLLGSRGLGSSPTDLNTISANALDRVEVLRDGAAAQYGSDAIAGVMNLTLKSDDHGGNVLVNNGIHQSGFGYNTTLSVNKGLKLGKQGFLNLTGEADYRGYTTSKDYQRELNVWPVFSGNQKAENDSLKAYNKTYKDYRQRNGDAQMTNYRAVYNAGVTLSPTVKLYSFGTYNFRRGKAVAPWVLPSANRLDLGTRPEFKLGYQPGINTRIHDVAAVLGLDVKLGAWNLDLSQSIGHNRMQYDTENTINPTLGAGTTQTTFDNGGLRLTQAVTNATFSRLFDKVLAGTNVAVGAEFRNDGYNIVAGEANSYRDGGRGQVVPDPDSPGDSLRSTPGSQGFIGFSPSPGAAPRSGRSSSRQNTAAFVDVEADIVKGWTVGAAVRAEKYSDVTDPAVIYKIASRVRATDWLALRVGFNTGFRAPTLQQTQYEQLTLLPTASGTTYEGIYNNTSPLAAAAGIAKLTPETSRNFSAGLVLTPTDKLTLTVDAYRIDIKNRISLTNAFNTDSIPALKAFVQGNRLDIAGARFFANDVNTKTQGLDVVASYAVPLGRGTLRLKAAANFSKTEADLLAPPPAFLKTENDPRVLSNKFIGQRQLSLITTGNPKSRILASVGYEGNKLGVTARYTRFGEVSLYDFNFDDNAEGAYLLRFAPTSVTDLYITYKPTTALQFSLGGQNIFDVLPDDVITAAKQGKAPGKYTSYKAYEEAFPLLHPKVGASNLPSDRDILPYQQVQQGSNGAFFYLKASYSFGL